MGSWTSFLVLVLRGWYPLGISKYTGKNNDKQTDGSTPASAGAPGVCTTNYTSGVCKYCKVSFSINSTHCTRCLRVLCELCKDDPDKVNMNYKSKRGLSGHQRQAHPATYHTNNVPKKKRWDDEELVVMAQ